MRDQAIYIKAIASEKIQIKLDAVGALTVEGLQAIRIGPEQRELFEVKRSPFESPRPRYSHDDDRGSWTCDPYSHFERFA